MIKALPTTELFQIIKRCIWQSALNFQKCYERDQNMVARSQGVYNRAGGRGPNKSNSLKNGQIY